MATTKKTTPKLQSSAKKKAPVKKISASKKATKRVLVSRSKKSSRRLISLEKQSTPFMTTSTSRETLYWVVLGIIVILFAAWVLKLQADIETIYDSIDASSNMIIESPQKHSNHKH